MVGSGSGASRTARPLADGAPDPAAARPWTGPRAHGPAAVAGDDRGAAAVREAALKTAEAGPAPVVALPEDGQRVGPGVVGVGVGDVDPRHRQLGAGVLPGAEVEAGPAGDGQHLQ